MVYDCYKNGIGILKDLQKANNWFQKLKKLISDDLKEVLPVTNNQLLYILYNEFENIKEIGKGGFATVYSANWFNQNLWKTVALKLLRGSNSHREEFIKELKTFCEISYKSPTFLKCFGISKDYSTKDYILVMGYAEKGSLHKNLDEIAKTKWENKLNLLLCIASDLETIHSQDIIHRDLHSGNILLDESYNAYITDLGLSIAINLKSEPNEIYGVLPYIAPEVLMKEQYTKASDIYSFGMIMLEIFTGCRPYHDTSHDENLAIKICLGSKPEIKCKVPQLFLALINKCLDGEAQDRPTAKELVGILKKWLLDLNDEKTKLYEQVEAIKNSAINSSIDYQTHEQAIYTGRRLSFPKLSNPVKKGNENLLISKPVGIPEF